MPVVNAIDKEFATCEVTYPTGEKKRGRYHWTRADGKMVVEVRTNFGNKTRKLFDADCVELYPNTKVVVK